MKDKVFEAKLIKAIFGDATLKKTDCETCELQYDCEKLNGKNPDGTQNINGCLKS